MPSTDAVTGAVEDPGASPLAAAAVLDGRRLYPRRADIRAVVAIADPVRTAELVEPIRPRLRCVSPTGRPIRTVAGGATWRPRWPLPPGWLAAGTPDDEEVARLACASPWPFVTPLYALAVGADAGAAESLWSGPAHTPEPWRVEALVLLAFFGLCQRRRTAGGAVAGGGIAL